MLKITVSGTDAVDRRFRNMPDSVRRALTTKVLSLVLRLETHIKNDKLSGQVLNTVTGRLKRSIHHQVSETSTGAIVGSVFSTGDVPYASIHEFGGQTSPHVIVPVKAKALAFMMEGKEVFAKIVHHPGSRIPQRSYLRSSLADMRETIRSEIAQAVREAVR